MKILLLLLVLFSCTSFSQKNIRNVSSSLIDESCVFKKYSPKELDDINDEIKSNLGNNYKLTKKDHSNKNFLKYGFSEVSHNSIYNKDTNNIFSINVSNIFYFDLNGYLHNNLEDDLWSKICGNALLIPKLQYTSLINKELSPFIIATLRQMQRHNFKNKYSFVLGDTDNILSLSALKLGADRVYLFQLEEKTISQRTFPLSINSYTEDHILYVNPQKKFEMINIVRGYNKDVVVVSSLGRNYEKNNGKLLTNKYSILLADYFSNITEYILGGYRSHPQFDLAHIAYDRNTLLNKEFQYNHYITRFKPERSSFAHFLSHTGEDFIAYSWSAFYIEDKPKKLFSNPEKDKIKTKKPIDIFLSPRKIKTKKENKRNSSDFIRLKKSRDQIKELLDEESRTIYENSLVKNTSKAFSKKIKQNKLNKLLKENLEARKKARPYLSNKAMVLNAKSTVVSVAVSPLGKYIAAGCLDKTIRIWDAKSGQELKILNGHEDSVESVSWNPSGKLIASGSRDKTVRIWDVKSGQNIKVLDKHKDLVASVSWNPSRKLIASGSFDGTIRTWDAKSGQELKILGKQGEPPGRVVLSIFWDPNGQFIASSEGRSSIKIWNAKSGKKVKSIDLSNDLIDMGDLSWDPTGQFIASTGAGRYGPNIIIWDTKSDQISSTLREEYHTGYITSNSWDPTGEFIASGSSKSDSIGIWHPKSEKIIKLLEGHKDSVNSVSWAPTGEFIASGSNDESVRIWYVKYK